MMPNNRLWLLIARQVTGEASPAEGEELRDLVEEHPEKQYLLDLLHSYFDARPAGMDFTSADFEERFHKIVREEEADLSYPGNTSSGRDSPDVADIQTVTRVGLLPGKSLNRRVVPRMIIRYAAAVTAILVLGWGIHRLTRPPAKGPDNKPAMSGINEVVARPGARTKLVLPDGTQVWLNSGSKLNYQGGFNMQAREVELEGEAFFDVVKNPRLPFIVHASSIVVKVLGTTFTVKSYPQDPTIETTLLNGIIEVTRQDIPSTPRIILKPNEKLIFSKLLIPATIHANGNEHSTPPMAGPGISVSSIEQNVSDSDKVETSWMYNKLVFNGDTFQELAEKMERWYNVKILFKDKGLYKYRFGGVFANETVQDALNALQLTAQFTYKINNNEIELYKK